VFPGSDKSQVTRSLYKEINIFRHSYDVKEINDNFDGLINTIISSSFNKLAFASESTLLLIGDPFQDINLPFLSYTERFLSLPSKKLNLLTLKSHNNTFCVSGQFNCVSLPLNVQSLNQNSYVDFSFISLTEIFTYSKMLFNTTTEQNVMIDLLIHNVIHKTRYLVFVFIPLPMLQHHQFFLNRFQLYDTSIDANMDKKHKFQSITFHTSSTNANGYDNHQKQDINHNVKSNELFRNIEAWVLDSSKIENNYQVVQPSAKVIERDELLATTSHINENTTHGDMIKESKVLLENYETSRSFILLSNACIYEDENIVILKVNNEEKNKPLINMSFLAEDEDRGFLYTG
jgi:hypothetical protein